MRQYNISYDLTIFAISENEDMVDIAVVAVAVALEDAGAGAFLTPWTTSTTDIVGSHICPFTEKKIFVYFQANFLLHVYKSNFNAGHKISVQWN